MGISAVPNLFVKQQLTTKLAASETLKDDTVVRESLFVKFKKLS